MEAGVAGVAGVAGQVPLPRIRQQWCIKSAHGGVYFRPQVPTTVTEL